jgi:anti-sigma factor RsiW
MHEELHTLLNAYLDGELQGRRLQEMESHLAACDSCRKELEELRLVSEWMRNDTSVEAIPAERFVSQLTLSLARRSQPSRPTRSISLAGWLVPAGLLMAWIFIQTAYALTDVVTAVNASGLLGNVSTWLGSGQESTWMSAATAFFGGQILAQPAISLLNSVSVAVGDLLGGFVWQAGIVVLYWAWMVAWWLRHNPRTGRNLIASR